MGKKKELQRLADSLERVAEAMVLQTAQTAQQTAQTAEMLQKMTDMLQQQLAETKKTNELLEKIVSKPDGYIYAFACEDVENLYKIGATKDPEERVKAIGSSTHKFTVVWTIYCPSNYAWETAVHRQLSHMRMPKWKGREYYCLTADDVDAIHQIVQGYYPFGPDDLAQFKNEQPILAKLDKARGDEAQVMHQHSHLEPRDKFVASFTESLCFVKVNRLESKFAVKTFKPKDIAISFQKWVSDHGADEIGYLTDRQVQRTLSRLLGEYANEKGSGVTLQVSGFHKAFKIFPFRFRKHLKGLKMYDISGPRVDLIARDSGVLERVTVRVAASSVNDQDDQSD